MRRFLTYCLFLTIAFVDLSGQISPGDLSEKHKHLEGIRNCTNCHVLGEKETSTRCLACHKEIASRIQTKKGYHASSEVKGKECAECHNDHHGREFQLVELDKEQFDHTLTGYRLEGAHGEQECSACHKNVFVKGEDLKKKTTTFLGLQQECVTCHVDVHRETLSDNCGECHGMDRFKPATGFNHDLSDFALLGKHQSVDCEKCHRKELIDDQVFQHFSNVDHQKCTSCHEDVHENKFGQNCTKCHSEQSFTQIKDLTSFDHRVTGFPLKGMHAHVECKSCHKSSFTDPLPHSNCSNCHSDFHKGEFSSHGNKADCSECHTENGFEGSLFTIDQHNKINFKLQGAHMATPCFACHQKNEHWQFRNIGKDCVDCHMNTHEGQMDIAYHSGGCPSCHTVVAWTDVKFDHEQTGFSLLGKHADVACGTCHYPKNKDADIVQKFADLDNTCVQCHTDIHLGQFAKYGYNACINCHTFNDWKENKFNHNEARFKLDGKHENLECVECHQLARMPEGRTVKYIFDNIKCESCHK